MAAARLVPGTGASAEQERARLGRHLHGATVADVMSAAPVVADPDATVARFIDQTALRTRCPLTRWMAVADMRASQPYPLFGADLKARSCAQQV